MDEVKSRHTKRWLVAGWAVLVVAGGGLTSWLQDGTRDAPVSWQEVEPQRDVGPPGTGDVPSACDSPRPEPSTPTPSWPPGEFSGEAEIVDVLCIEAG